MKKAIITLTATAALAFPATAMTHVSITETEQPSDGFAFLDLAVPHGCDEAGTTRISVRIPEDVPLVTPEVEPGWKLSTKEGPKEEVELFGDTITDGVSEVTWTTEEPLPSDFVTRFTIEVKLPAAEGEAVYFPTIQTCERGETAWVEIPAEGETSDDLESPAPAVTLVEAEEGHHGGGTAQSDDVDAEHSEGEKADSSDESDGRGDGDGMAMAALIVGGLGFLFGGASLVRSRKS